jgi:hypothetical protein
MYMIVQLYTEAKSYRKFLALTTPCGRPNSSLVLNAANSTAQKGASEVKLKNLSLSAPESMSHGWHCVVDGIPLATA